MSALVARDLSIGYGATRVAQGLNLSIEPGSVTCLLGPNGVGKSTFFKTLLGLIPPLAGVVEVDGDDIGALDRAAIARRIAYVPQAQPSDFAYTALDLVVMGRTAYLGAFRSPQKADYALAQAALDTLGVGALAGRDTTRISGGQRQLVLIARALAQDARLIIMDEPTASLDLGNRLAVLDVVRRISEQGRAVLLSTHEPEQAFAAADRVAVFGRGDRFRTGAVEEVLTSDEVSALYGVPLQVETTPSGRRVVSAVKP